MEIVSRISPGIGELLERIMSITSCDKIARIMLDRQKRALRTRMLAVIKCKKKVKSEEEARCAANGSQHLLQ